MKEDMNENVLGALCKVYFPQLAFVGPNFSFSPKLLFFIMLQVQFTTP